MSTCPHCHVPLQLDASGCCENCGQPFAATETAPTTLAINGYTPGAPPGLPSSFQIRLQPAPGLHLKQALVQLRCTSFEAPVSVTLTAQQQFQAGVEFIPDRAGTPLLEVELQAQCLETQRWLFLRGAAPLLILGKDFDTRLINAWRQEVEIHAPRGLVRLPEGMAQVNKLRIHAEEGLVNLSAEALRRGDRQGTQDFQIRLTPIDHNPTAPQPLRLARLLRPEGASVALSWLIPWEAELIMGRQGDTDIPLRLHPLEGDQDRISRRWIRLISGSSLQVEDIRTIGTQKGTRLDDIRLGVGSPIQPWLPHQTLILRDLLGLRYRREDDYLHLTRTLNGIDQEDFLLLGKAGYPLGKAARLMAGEGGFLLRALDSGVQINDQLLPVGKQQGLWDGDTLTVNSQRVDFRAGRT